MPDPPPLSGGSLLVLRDLRDADGMEVMMVAIKELVALGVFELEREEPHSPPTRSRPRLLLIPTEGRQAEGDRLLAWMDRAIRRSPLSREGTRMAYEVSGVSRSIAFSDPRAKKSVVARVLDDLAQRGLVRSQQRRTLGVTWRRETVRTPAGDAVLAAANGRRDDQHGGSESLSGRYVWRERAETIADFADAFNSGFSGGGGDGAGGGGGDSNRSGWGSWWFPD